MLKPKKIKSCAADRDEGGRIQGRVFGPDSLSGSVKDEGAGNGRRKNE